ncbi:hypothetical protein RN01_15260 [Cupriavidus sp. SHE]|jgi:hypothetical protein|uniref:DUF2188 domain-containing protein n=1 Tax=Cupriavidus metallidurans TaxID=119219 RepID=A0A482IZF2_9BURK|nr:MULTISPECIES: hypothetical protein [Cupriavidus]KWR81643.1 hypothetical protein RN01_15260 [Cupriavidus sp. SHE]QBP12963.1 hypothetical protein DDF84_025255 [Cupriavidus metallidurans]
MSTSIVKVLVTQDNHWAVESDGQLNAYASRGAAIAAGVHKAIKERAMLMIYEREAHASEPIEPIESSDVGVLGRVPA